MKDFILPGKFFQFVLGWGIVGLGIGLICVSVHDFDTPTSK